MIITRVSSDAMNNYSLEFLNKVSDFNDLDDAPALLCSIQYNLEGNTISINSCETCALLDVASCKLEDFQKACDILKDSKEMLELVNCDNTANNCSNQTVNSIMILVKRTLEYCIKSRKAEELKAGNLTNTEDVISQPVISLDMYALELLNRLMAYKASIKTLHWNARNWSNHLLFDKIDDDLSDLIDTWAEVYFMRHKIAVEGLYNNPEYYCSSDDKIVDLTNSLLSLANMISKLSKEDSEINFVNGLSQNLCQYLGWLNILS